MDHCCRIVQRLQCAHLQNVAGVIVVYAVTFGLLLPVVLQHWPYSPFYSASYNDINVVKRAVWVRVLSSMYGLIYKGRPQWGGRVESNVDQSRHGGWLCVDVCIHMCTKYSSCVIYDKYFYLIKDGGCPPFEKYKNCHISATVKPIATEFGMTTHIADLNRNGS